MKYLEFLQWLIALGGDKLPRILAFLKAQIDLFSEYQDIFVSEAVFAGAIDSTSITISAEELAAEGELMGMLQADEGKFGAIGDGKFIEFARKAYAFYIKNKWIIDLFT